MVDESGEKFYMFRLVSQTLKIVEFVADFTGSRNCDFVDLKKPKAEGEEKYNLKSDGVYLERVYPSMVHTETGHAEVCEKRTDLAKVILRDGWKLKTQFKFTLHNLPREK